jgi:ABC-type sugar transport system ATPase subunit
MGWISPQGNSTGTPLVELHDISKQFGGVRAVDGISLEIPSGAVHALVGENGAGKSTLGKIIAGAIQPDAGRVLIEGTEVSLRSPREALACGIAAMAQELLVVGRLSVAENVFLGAEPSRGSWIRRGTLKSRYEQLAAQTGFSLPADRPVGGMRIAEQQQVEIMRALARDARLIVMDEPSAALSGRDVERLHEIIRSLVAQGKAVLLVSHFLREVLSLADTISVLRDGQLVRTSAAADETEAALIQGMLGRPLGAAFPEKPAHDIQAPVALAVRNVVAPAVADVSLEVREGEIVGLAGLVGAGRTELVRALFGADRRSSGTVELAGNELRPDHPLMSLRSGLAMIPESRREQGLLFSRSVLENVSLSSLDGVSRGSWVSRRGERAAVSPILERVALRGATPDSVVSTLSGGNQQKVLFARTLMCEPRVLIADEPTRGVDIGAKRAIYDLIVELASRGTAVLLVSSELEEVLGLSHRILVMRRGRVVVELEGEEMTESGILAAAFADPATTEVAA